MQRILYFTAGTTATTLELADIDKLNAAAAPDFEIIVLNGAANSEYGEPDRLIPCDFVAGTIPTIYSAIEEADPDALPGQPLVNGESVIVRNSVGADGHASTAVVTNGALVGINLGATVAMVDHGETLGVTGTGTQATFTVFNGVITAITLGNP